MLYVLYGTAVSFGIDVRPVFAEVHRSNMAKVGGGKRADGKVTKPAGWKPPRVTELLAGMSLVESESESAVGESAVGIEPNKAGGEDAIR
jgi:predicted HAD superfamily Cof-like phosphohydrolase